MRAGNKYIVLDEPTRKFLVELKQLRNKLGITQREVSSIFNADEYLYRMFDRECFDRSVCLAGNWEHIYIYVVSRECRASDSRMWSVVMNHVKFVGNSASHHTSKLWYVAVRYELSPNTVMKYRREFSVKLAEMFLMML